MTKFHTVKEARDVILATIQESLIENAKRFEALQKAELMKSDAGQWSASAHESSVKANAQSQQPSESERPRIAQLHVSAAARHVRAGLAHGPGAAQDHHFKQAEAHATQAHRTDVREAASSAAHWTKAGQTNHSSHENAYNQKLGQVLSSATEPGKSSLQKAEFGPQDEAKYQAHVKANDQAHAAYHNDPKNAAQIAENTKVRATVDKMKAVRDAPLQKDDPMVPEALQRPKLPRPSKMAPVEKCGETSSMAKSDENARLLSIAKVYATDADRNSHMPDTRQRTSVHSHEKAAEIYAALNHPAEQHHRTRIAAIMNANPPAPSAPQFPKARSLASIKNKQPSKSIVSADPEPKAS